jgi:hypothetical protein
MDMSIAGSFSSTSDGHEPLGADHDEAPQAQTISLDACLSSANVTRKGGIPSKHDVYFRKYISHWKLNHSMYVCFSFLHDKKKNNNE